MRRQQIFKQVKDAVRALDPDARVFLYGSRARGDHKKLSDWDFLVLTSRDFDYIQKGMLRDMLYDTELAADAIISAVIESKSVYPFRKMR